MTMRDALCQLSDSQAVTSDAVSSNTYDSGAAGNELGAGEGLGVEVLVEVAADHTTGDETYEFQLIQSASADLSSPDVLGSRTIAAADLVAGFSFVLPLPAGAKTKRYLGLNYNTGGTTPSVTVSAYLQPLSMIQSYKAYDDNVTIS